VVWFYNTGCKTAAGISLPLLNAFTDDLMNEHLILSSETKAQGSRTCGNDAS
jgi:hypothetical protein